MAGPAHALIVADGDVDVAAMRRLAPGSPDGDEILLIAADGGAAKVLAADLLPDIVVGDFDSLRPAERVRLEGLGIDLREARADKDESDMELCILTAIEAGAARISILGALGGSRPEHTLANIWLLADPRFAGVEIEILGNASRTFLVGTLDGPGHGRIDGVAGDFVSLFPVGGPASGVTTEGLRFPLRDEELPVGPSRGLSNELLAQHGSVTTGRGRLLIVHTAGTQAE
jgi:thiamine pyrophosphokinase